MTPIKVKESQLQECWAAYVAHTLFHIEDWGDVLLHRLPAPFGGRATLQHVVLTPSGEIDHQFTDQTYWYLGTCPHTTISVHQASGISRAVSTESLLRGYAHTDYTDSIEGLRVLHPQHGTGVISLSGRGQLDPWLVIPPVTEFLRRAQFIRSLVLSHR